MKDKIILISILLILILVSCKENIQSTSESNLTTNTSLINHKTINNDVVNNSSTEEINSSTTEVNQSDIDEEYVSISESIDSETSLEIDIDVGDPIHKFKIIFKATPLDEDDDDILYDSELIISIFDYKNLTEPYQVLKNKANGNLFFEYEIIDANFDGYNDFRYLVFRGNSNTSANYFLWDSNNKVYKYSEELSNLSSVVIDPESEIITEFNKSGASHNYTRFYVYRDDVLELVRAIYMYPAAEEGVMILRVEGILENGLQDVYFEEFTYKSSNLIFDEYLKWENLNYDGD